MVPTFAIIAAIAPLTVTALETQAAESLDVETVKNMSAVVESIDQSRHVLWLRNRDGMSFMVEVPAQVRHLTTVKAGDNVMVRYHESTTAAVKSKGAGKILSDVDRIAHAALETTPDKVAERTVSTTVVIQSVDKSTYAVAYKDENGFSRNTTITNPDAQKFAATLKEGDQVDITYTETWTVSVEFEK